MSISTLSRRVNPSPHDPYIRLARAVGDALLRFAADMEMTAFLPVSAAAPPNPEDLDWRGITKRHVPSVTTPSGFRKWLLRHPDFPKPVRDGKSTTWAAVDVSAYFGSRRLHAVAR